MENFSWSKKQKQKTSTIDLEPYNNNSTKGKNNFSNNKIMQTFITKTKWLEENFRKKVTKIYYEILNQSDNSHSINKVKMKNE